MLLSNHIPSNILLVVIMAWHHENYIVHNKESIGNGKNKNNNIVNLNNLK